MMFGMARCGDCSATLSAIADMPLTSAMAANGGANGLIEASFLRTPWQAMQTCNARAEPRPASPCSWAIEGKPLSAAATTLAVGPIHLLQRIDMTALHLFKAGLSFCFVTGHLIDLAQAAD